MGVRSTEVAQDDGFIDHKDLIIGEGLSHSVIADRLAQVDAWKIQRDAGNGDYEYLANLLESGFRGYHNMSPGELWTEWKETEEQWNTLNEDNELPWITLE